MAEEKFHRGPAKPAEIVAAVKSLREYHRMGQDSLTEAPERVPYGKSSELLRKARSVAQAFSDKELEELIELCRSAEFALPRSHLDRLATIRHKRSRMAITRKAISERWSRPTVDAVIRKRFGSRHRNPMLGRLPRKPLDRQDAYAEWLRLALRVVRYGEMLGWTHSGAMRSSTAGDITLADLPKVQREANAALSACSRLMAAAQDAIGHEVSRG